MKRAGARVHTGAELCTLVRAELQSLFAHRLELTGICSPRPGLQFLFVFLISFSLFFLSFSSSSSSSSSGVICALFFTSVLPLPQVSFVGLRLCNSLESHLVGVCGVAGTPPRPGPGNFDL